MPDYLETTVDKFTFKVATDRLYTAEGVWAQGDGGRARVGVTDYLQQRSGDVAFAEVKLAGTPVARDEELGSIETVKANISLGAPVAGTVMEVTPLLATAPETIFADPYGAGWLVKIEMGEAEELSALMNSDGYDAYCKERSH